MANFGGQLCTKPGVVFVPAGEAGDAFAADVASRLDDVEPKVLLNERLRDALREAVSALEDRVERLGGGGEAGGPGFRHQPSAYRAAAADVAAAPELLEEHFGPVVLFLTYSSRDDLLAALERLDGQLTALAARRGGRGHRRGRRRARPARRPDRLRRLPDRRRRHVRMHHGGPFPLHAAPAHTSVGMTAIRRWLRPIAFQNAPEAVLPPELRRDNPLGIWRRVDGELTRERA